MGRFNFWRGWLIVCGIMMIVFGVVLLSPALFNAEFSYINSAFWESGIIPAEAKRFYNWMFAMYAAMELASALFILLVALYPFKRKEKWAWYCLFSCISVWFIIDTSFSLFFKVYINAINNCILYVLLILPLLFTKREFS